MPSNTHHFHATVEDTGPRLVVTNPVQRSVGLVVFLCAWLSMWTVGGAFAFGTLLGSTTPLGVRLFMLVWVCGWALGEFSVLAVLAWQFGGRETITVARDALTVERKAYGYGSTRAFEPDRVSNVRVITPTLVRNGHTAGSLARLRTGSGWVAFDHDGVTHRFGMKLGREEANFVAEEIREKLAFWDR